MPAPPRIDADSASFAQLTTLDRLLKFLETQKTPAKDALKVVRCLRFIKVNQQFVQYAIENKDDPLLYSESHDLAKGVIRDLHGMGIQISGYQGDSIAGLAQLNQWVLAVEQSFEAAEKNTRILEFIAHFKGTNQGAYLEHRLAPVLAYGALPNFRDLIQQIEGSFSTRDQAADYEIVFKFFKPYCNQKVIFNGQEVILSDKHIVDYMIRTYSYTIPTPRVGTSSPSLTAPPVAVATQSSKVDAALKLIKELRAVVKIINCPPTDSKDFTYNISMLVDPNALVSPKGIPKSADRTKIWNTFRAQWQQRYIRSQRGMAKKSSHPHYGFTKKTSVTLLQPDGRTLLFGYDVHVFNFALGFLFNLDTLKFKTDAQGNNKYIWPINMRTKDAWWLYNHQKLSQSHKSITLDTLKSSLKSAVTKGESLEHNEMLMCLRKEGLAAIFAPSNHILLRLNALRVQRIIKNYLGIELPFLIITPQAAPHEYTKAMQSKDLFKIVEYDNSLYSTLLKNVLPYLAKDEINQLDEDQNSLLMNAITYKNWTIVAALLNRQDIIINDPVTNFPSTLLAAMECDHYDTVKKLLERLGSEFILSWQLTATSHQKCTLFDVAMSYKSDASVTLLEPYLAKQQLCYAAKINDTTLVAQLLARPVSVTTSLDYDKNTALMWAIRHRNVAMVQQLLPRMLQEKANFLAKNNVYSTALLYAQKDNQDDIEILILACEKLQHAAYSAAAMFDVLYKAVLTKNHTLITVLLTSKLAITSDNSAANYALLRAAAFNKDYNTVLKLIAAGFHGFKDYGNETLLWALQEGHLVLAHTLLQQYSHHISEAACRKAYSYAMGHNYKNLYPNIISFLERRIKPSYSFWVTKDLTQAAQLPESFKEAAAPLVMLP